MIPVREENAPIFPNFVFGVIKKILKFESFILFLNCRERKKMEAFPVKKVFLLFRYEFHFAKNLSDPLLFS